MRAGVRLRQRLEQLHARRAMDDAEVELAVVDARIGTMRIPPPYCRELPTVANMISSLRVSLIVTRCGVNRGSTRMMA